MVSVPQSRMTAVHQQGPHQNRSYFTYPMMSRYASRPMPPGLMDMSVICSIIYSDNGQDKKGVQAESVRCTVRRVFSEFVVKAGRRQSCVSDTRMILMK